MMWLRLLARDIFFCAALFATLASCHDIHIDQQNGTDSTSCWDGELACKSLGYALNGLHKFNQTTLWLQPDNYTILNNNNAQYEFIYSEDVAIVGLENNAQVFCNKAFGISFLNSTNVTIYGISFTGCGALQISTSKNFSNQNSFNFADFYATLYFLYCKDITLEFVRVSDSLGIGAVFYSTVGENLINQAEFSNNTAAVSSKPGGGGLYIEFCYCVPSLDHSYDNCTVSNVRPEFNMNSQFTITNSIFNLNQATILNSDEHAFILPQESTHLAFGRGGGLSVFYKGNSSNNTVFVSNCSFSNNKALWGSGLFVEVQDNSHSNHFIIEHSNVTNNSVWDSSTETGTGGGGARIGFIFFNITRSENNIMQFSHVQFTENSAYYGGGLSFYVSRENSSVATNKLFFDNCLWERNRARVGKAADFSVWHPVPAGSVVKPVLENCTFSNNDEDYTGVSYNGTFVGIGAVYADSIPLLFTGEVKFSHNSQTALAAVSTGIYISSNTVAKFHNNTGRTGGALALMGYAFIEVSDNSVVHFTKNTAELKGGAIYGHSIGEHDLISSRNCIIRYYDIRSEPKNWRAKFLFERNRADGKLNSIYVTSLLNCIWGGAFGNGSTNNSIDVFCWNKVNKNWVYSEGNCSSNIATAPARFQPLKRSSPNNSITLIPGKRKLLPFTCKDDQNKDVTSSTVLIARLVADQDNVSLDSTSVYISDNSLEMHGSPNTTARVLIETMDPRVISTQINITLLDCPPGMYFDNGDDARCTCLDKNYNRRVLCDPNKYATKIQIGYWIGLNQSNSSNYSSSVVVGRCLFCVVLRDLYQNNDSNITDSNSGSRYEGNFIDLPSDVNLLDSDLCGTINRTDILCSKCKPGFGPAVNSPNFNCVECPYEEVRYYWVFYLITEFLPITLFFFVVLIFNVSVTSGPANSFVFFAQMITTAITINGDGALLHKHTSLIDDLFRVFPYSIWNLGFFRPWLPQFCISSSISTLTLLSTGYVTAFYPLLLVFIFYVLISLYSKGVQPFACLFRPIHACFARFSQVWDIQKSIVHALATFLVLSYTKFTQVSFTLLSATPLINETGDVVSYNLYYDGSITLGSTEHLVYLLASIFVLTTFVAIPPILLIAPSVVHYIQKCCKRAPDMCGGAGLSQFYNAFHGCYKDGTGGQDPNENKYDFRWFSGLYFILRIQFLSMTAFTDNWVSQTVVQQMLSVAVLVAIVILRPYKNDLYNKIDAAFFGIIAVLCSLSLQNYYASAVENEIPGWTLPFQYTLLLVPIIYIVLLVLYHLWGRNKKLIRKLWSKLTRKSQLENLVQNDDDFLDDAEQAGRFADDATRPLIPAPGGRTSGSSDKQSSGDDSTPRYGATPDSFGVDKFDIQQDEPKVDFIETRNRRKNYFTK